MSKQRDRDEFINIMTQEGVPLHVSQALLRAETTLHRIAELQCSSEAADRDRVMCPGGDETCLCRDYGNYDYDADKHGTVPRICVKEAKMQARLLKLANQHGISLVFNGDPRGPAILVSVPSGRTNDWGRRGVVVP
jgi:hypothetical protein